LLPAMDEPKKPPSAYFLYVNSTREAVQTEIGSKKFGEVTKLQADRWKSLPAAEKAKYEKQATDGKAKYEKDLAAFKEGGGVVGQRRQDKKASKQTRVDKAAKKEANADRPKKPAGGAYGVYVSKNRAEIVKSLPPGHKCTAVTLAASERWKKMTADDKKPYEEEYQQKKAQYETELKAWKEAKGSSADAKDEDEEEEEDEDEESSPQKANAKKEAGAKKRAAPEATESPAAKKAKGKAKPESPPAKKAKGEGRGKKKEAASPEGVKIPPEILEQAKKEKFEAALTNLASRQDVVDKNISADKLLAALQKSGGLVNKAKAALLGA